MPTKRRNSSSPECENSPKRLHVPPVERVEHDQTPYDDLDESEPDERPYIDAYTGQAGAFPGLSNGGEDIFYGPANDGLDYLRMVRSEAKGIPQLLRADVEDIGWAEDQNEGEDGGYWDNDGTYTALPAMKDQNSQEVLPKAQTKYYDSLLAQFALARATLKCVPPLSAIESLTSSQPISFPTENKKARLSWEQCLETRDPTSAQIACMDDNSILQLIKLLTVQLKVLSRSESLRSVKRTSAWVWAALGKCPDRGQLGSEEVSQLRQLAQECVKLRDWSVDKTQYMLIQSEQVTEESEDIAKKSVVFDTALVTEIEAAKQRLVENDDTLRNSLDESMSPLARYQVDASSDTADEAQLVKQERSVTFDMVLTVVGEVYGQRDLLELRKHWGNSITPAMRDENSNSKTTIMR